MAVKSVMAEVFQANDGTRHATYMAAVEHEIREVIKPFTVTDSSLRTYIDYKLLAHSWGSFIEKAKAVG